MWYEARSILIVPDNYWKRVDVWMWVLFVVSIVSVLISGVPEWPLAARVGGQPPRWKNW
jgi:hypothetical protein